MVIDGLLLMNDCKVRILLVSISAIIGLHLRTIFLSGVIIDTATLTAVISLFTAPFVLVAFFPMYYICIGWGP